MHDVCIVGTGPAGSVLAYQLSKLGYNIALVNAAGSFSEGASDALPENFGIDSLNTDESVKIDLGRSFNLGGSTNLWAGRLATYNDSDFDSLWPIKFEKYSEYIPQAFDILGIKSVLKPPYSQLVNYLCSENIAARLFAWAPTPFNSWEWLNSSDAKFTLYQKHIVRNIICENSSTASFLDCIDLKLGKPVHIHAKLFVIAAGGIETVRLLLNSNRYHAHGIGNHSNKLGKYFSTHPKLNIATLKFFKKQNTSDPLLSDFTSENGVTYRYGLGITDSKIRCKSTLNHFFQFTPSTEDISSKIFDNFRGLVPQKAYSKDLVSVGRLAFNTIGKISKFTGHIRQATIRTFLDQSPSISNSIVLSDQKDQFGSNKVDINWHYSREDKRTVIDSLKTLNASFEANNIGSIDISHLSVDSPWPFIGIHSHFLGGTRMGSDPLTSVTNFAGRVHYTENIYISRPSLFPTYSYANPVLTISTLAIHQSKYIHKKLKEIQENTSKVD